MTRPNAHDRMPAIQHMRAARVLVENAYASIEHCCSRGSDVSIEQQAPYILEDLKHTLNQVECALSKVGEEAEARPAGSYVPARAA